MILLSLTIALYLVGAIAVGLLVCMLIALGGREPSFKDGMMAILMVVFWPITAAWFICKTLA